MKIKLLSVAIMLCMIQPVSYSAISVDQITTEEYLRNNGYSKQIYDIVNVGRARALGEEFYSSEERELQKASKTKRFFRKLQAYIDPAVDDYSFYHHDISPEPNVDDF